MSELPRGELRATSIFNGPYGMGWGGLLSFVLGVSRLVRLAFVCLSAWKLYTADNRAFFYTYVSVFGLIYLIDVIIFANSILNLILSIFGLVWFRVPFIVTKPKFRTRIVVAIVFELIDCLCGSYFTCYLMIPTRVIPLGFTIPHLVFSLMSLPIAYDGTLLTPELEIRVADYLKILIESFLTVSFFSIFFTLKHFWIYYVVGIVWRFVSCCEPFAFWSTMHLIVSPFRAINLSSNARTMLVTYALTMELFLTIYCAFWYMQKATVNLVFVIVYSVYSGVFLLVQLCSSLSPFSHRVKAMPEAKLENPEVFDPAIL